MPRGHKGHTNWLEFPCRGIVELLWVHGALSELERAVVNGCAPLSTRQGEKMALEIVGYVGSFLIGLSLTMSNIKKLRWINLFGASTFATYGVLIKAWPVLFLNGFIVLTDIWHIVKMSRTSETCSVVALEQRPSAYLKRFVSFYKEDIAEHFPGFKLPTKAFKAGGCSATCKPLASSFIVDKRRMFALIDIDYVALLTVTCARRIGSSERGLAHLREAGIQRLEAHPGDLGTSTLPREGWLYRSRGGTFSAATLKGIPLSRSHALGL